MKRRILTPKVKAAMRQDKEQKLDNVVRQLAEFLYHTDLLFITAESLEFVQMNPQWPLQFGAKKVARFEPSTHCIDSAIEVQTVDARYEDVPLILHGFTAPLLDRISKTTMNALSYFETDDLLYPVGSKAIILAVLTIDGFNIKARTLPITAIKPRTKRLVTI